MRRPNLRIIGVEEGKKCQLKGTVNIFNKIIEEKFPTLKNEITINMQKAHRTPNKLGQNRNSSLHLIVKTLNIQNKES